jgi:hypothetical protein
MVHSQAEVLSVQYSVPHKMTSQSQVLNALDRPPLGSAGPIAGPTEKRGSKTPMTRLRPRFDRLTFTRSWHHHHHS